MPNLSLCFIHCLTSMDICVVLVTALEELAQLSVVLTFTCIVLFQYVLPFRLHKKSPCYTPALLWSEIKAIQVHTWLLVLDEPVPGRAIIKLCFQKHPGGFSCFSHTLIPRVASVL